MTAPPPRRPRLALDLRCLDIPSAAGRGIGTVAREVASRLPARLPGVDVIPVRAADLAVPSWLRTGRSRIDLALETPQLLRHLARLRADALLAAMPYGLPLVGGPPSVAIFYDAIHWRAAGGSLEDRLEGAYRSLLVRALRRARRVVAISRFSARDAVSFLGLRPTRISVAPLAAAARFRPPPAAEVEAMRARHGLGPRALLYVGGADPRKGLPHLLRAMTHVARAAPDAVLALVGRVEEHERAPLDQAIRAASLDPTRLRLLGPAPVEDLPALYAAARVFAFPSRCEGFGLPPLEAMACGTACVSFDNSAIPEVTGAAALLVPDGDERALAEALVRVLHDDGLRDGLRSAGLAQAARFSWDRTAGHVADAVRGLLASMGLDPGPA